MPNEEASSASKRIQHIRALNARTANLDLQRVNECKEAIWKSYEAASLPRHVAIIAKEQSMEAPRFKSIGFRHLIRLTEFNAPNYYWGPYFSDVGRAIANGERKYLHKRMGRRVTGDKETISRSNPNFSILTERIKYLKRNNLDPDTLLAPIKIFVDFVKFYDSLIDWSHGRPEQLVIEDCRLKVFWSHKYAQLNSFLIFNSKAGIWHVIPDVETGRAVTIALGESIQLPGRVEYWVETLARYEILDVQAFYRINVSQ